MESVHEIQEFVRGFFLTLGAGEKKLMKIDLLVEEIIVNIVRYGGMAVESGSIDVGMDTANHKIILEISDNGLAFNPLEQEAPDLTAGLDERRPGGLGIFFVKQIAAEIRYERRGDKNHLRLCLDP
jgi:anti-sigma regulatory factor (Ser/Thr protein kinase)